jgi:tetratricopeptide (TPR) repeat protein
MAVQNQQTKNVDADAMLSVVHGDGPSPVSRSEVGMRERIRLLVELSRSKEAVELARAARARGDHTAELDELEGLALIRLGDPKAALEALQRGLRQAPDRPHLHYLWSFAARAVGRTEDARAALWEALRRAPEEPVYLRAEAEMWSERKEHTRALESARAAVRCGPERAANYVTLGYVASAAGDKALARQSYDQALKLDPEDATAWNNLGCLDLEAGQGIVARERFRESLRLAPEGQRARRNLDQALSGHTLEGFRRFEDMVRALAEELAEAGRTRLLLALAFEADGARVVLNAALERPGKLQVGAALGALSAGVLIGLVGSMGAPRLFGAGLGLIASVGAAHAVEDERRRVRRQLASDRTAFEAIRRDWLEGRLERSARDAAVRRLVERASLALCKEEERA